MRSRCNQRNQIQPYSLQTPSNSSFSSNGTSGKISPSMPTSAAFFHKTLCSIRKHYICICHKHHRNTGILPDLLNHLKNLVRRNSTGQCTDICCLNHRTLCGRVRKRDSQFDQICPASSMAYTSCSVTSSDGSPQVINGINAFPFVKLSVILLFMDILPSVAGNRYTVFISFRRW